MSWVGDTILSGEAFQCLGGESLRGEGVRRVGDREGGVLGLIGSTKTSSLTGGGARGAATGCTLLEEDDDCCRR